MGRGEQAGDESEEASESDDCHDKKEAFEGDDVAEASIAVDPIHDVKPVKMIQALRGSIEELQSKASKIIRNERAARIEDRNGVLQPVPDAGNRSCLESLVLDVQASVRGFDESAQANVERAVADTDQR